MKRFRHYINQSALGYLLKISFIELWHNAGSTFKISLVVAFIILPLILLHSLGLNFLKYTELEMENKFDLCKIDIVVANPNRDIITLENISELEKRDDVKFVQPIVTRGVQLIMEDGSMEEFDATASSNDDPTLKRIEAKGKFPDDDANWLFIHQSYQDKLLIDPDTKMVSLVVSSISRDGMKSRQYIIPFKVSGTYQKGGGREIYLPLKAMDRFNNWRKGYAITEWGLPGREDQEAALGGLYFKSVRAYSPYTVTKREEKNLSLANLSYETIPQNWGTTDQSSLSTQSKSAPAYSSYSQSNTTSVCQSPSYTISSQSTPILLSNNHASYTLTTNGMTNELSYTYITGTQMTSNTQQPITMDKPTVKHKTGLKISNENGGLMDEFRIGTVEDMLIRAGTPIMIPEPLTITVMNEGKPLTIVASTQKDPWQHGLLINGKWLTQNTTNIQMIVPENFADKSNVPYDMLISIHRQEVPVSVIGTCRGNNAFVLPRFLYRFGQINDNYAIFDRRTGKFGPVNTDIYYLAAHIFANKSDQVVSLESDLRNNYKYVVNHSNADMITDLQITKKRIYILIIVLAIAGILAVILSIAGTMGEAVRRKRRLIGLMRAMGVQKKGIAWFFIFQAFIYGVLGIILACVFQLLMIFTILERSWLYTILKASEDQHLFWPSIGGWFIFGCVTVLVCLAAGVIPALLATKFEPGEILSSAD